MSSNLQKSLSCCKVQVDTSEALLRIFPSGVEGTAGVVSFIVFTIVKLKNILLSHKLEQTCEYVSTGGTLESLRYPKNFESSRKEFCVSWCIFTKNFSKIEG
jgi:hypothetical protein